MATYSALRSFLYQQVDQQLEASHIPIEQALTRPRFNGPGQAGGVIASVDAYVGVRDPDGGMQGFSGIRRGGGDGAVAPKLPQTIALPVGQAEPTAYLTTGSSPTGGPKFRVRVSGLPTGQQLVLAVPLDNTEHTLHRLLTIEGAVTVLALLAAAGLGWWLVVVGLRPLREVEATAEAIAEGDFDRRVPGESNPTEVGRLARALNVMLARIQQAFAQRDATETERRSEERLRQFVADASHELRTPLSAVSAYAELFERGAGTRPDDLARVMAGIRAETGRMGELVEDLFLLARLDEGRPLQANPVELVGVASEAVAAAGAVGPAWPVRLQADRPVEVVGDATRLRQVVDNLLANVRAHTPEGTRVTVRVSQRGDDAVVEVADNGPGLTAEQAAKVFERFYRADPSRSRAHGGSGLGLAIVAAIVGAHHGRVEVLPTPGGGATFAITMPLLAPSVGGNRDSVPVATDTSQV